MLKRLKRAPCPFYITLVLWSDRLAESLQVGIRARWSRVRAPTMHSATRNSHYTVLAHTREPRGPVWVGLG
jgi:hypothetical protein